jgi:hypothetical protein
VVSIVASVVQWKRQAMEPKVRHGAGASRVNDNRFDVASNYTLKCLSFIGNWVDAALIVSFMCHIHVSNQGEVVKAIAGF